MVIIDINPVFIGLNGTPDRIRTCDLRFRKPLLYPTELREHLADLQQLRDSDLTGLKRSCNLEL